MSWIFMRTCCISGCAMSGGRGPDSGGAESLSADERAELVGQRAQVAEQGKGIAFLKKPRRSLRRGIEGEPG